MYQTNWNKTEKLKPNVNLKRHFPTSDLKISLITSDIEALLQILLLVLFKVNGWTNSQLVTFLETKFQKPDMFWLITTGLTSLVYLLALFDLSEFPITTEKSHHHQIKDLNTRVRNVVHTHYPKMSNAT